MLMCILLPLLKKLVINTLVNSILKKRKRQLKIVIRFLKKSEKELIYILKICLVGL
jgi:hypothetical protein